METAVTCKCDPTSNAQITALDLTSPLFLSASSHNMLRQSPADIQRDFYDGLRIRRWLQADRIRRTKAGDEACPNGVRVSKRTAWHMLLDDLCLLCDFRSGGSTTTAIAAEERADHTIFWVVSDPNRCEDLESHLSQMLELVKTAASDADRRDECKDLVFEHAVKRSARRVHNYVGRLSSAFRHVEVDTDEGEASPDFATTEDKCIPALTEHRLRAALRGLFGLREDHLALCREAYRLRRIPAVRTLLKRNKGGEYGAWFQIRHYLGRLGSWCRAADSVITHGRTFADVLERCHVATFDKSRGLGRESVDIAIEPEIVLNRVFPNFQGHGILSSARALMPDVATMSDWQTNGPCIPLPHAEASMLHYFSTNGLQFARGDGYIGCSKPSCYCCQKYFGIHPWRARTGRAHDNVWIKWALPSPLRGEDGSVDKNAIKIMRAMTDSVRKDIVAVIMTGGSPVGAMFDSTTGMTGSVQGIIQSIACCV